MTIRIRMAFAFTALLLASGVCGHAAEPGECVKLAVNPDGNATLSNVCGDRLNISYCVDNPQSPKDCSKISTVVITLGPTASESIPSYAESGSGAVYWAACVYPQAPVEWKPGPASAYTCRKTCVMC